MFVSQADKAGMAESHTNFGGIVTTMAEATEAKDYLRESLSLTVRSRLGTGVPRLRVPTSRRQG